MNLLTLLKNIVNLSRYNLLREINDCQRTIAKQESRLLFLELMNMDPVGFEAELAFLRSTGHPVMFPYPSLLPPQPVETGIDPDSRLPFVIHKGHRLYFPKAWSLPHVEKCYRIFIEQEAICGVCGGGCPCTKVPHRYQGGSVRVEPGDVVVDVGAAEGLFSLDVADLASRIILFENDAQWFAPLAHTFAPYKDKTLLVRKTVGDRDTRRSIRLSTALRNVPGERFFVKMDIEGAEVPVIASSCDFLAWPQDIRLACCTYHNAGDAEALERLFRKAGYSTAFSDGWMLYYHRPLPPPFFRRGVIRAWRAPA